MQKAEYHLIDVFTQEPFGGNPLAVFLNGQAIPDEAMQRIAKELNLSETTFVMPPQNYENDFWVRIFTPAREMQMAGHPTVGTAYALLQEGYIDIFEDMAPHEETIIFEEGVGDIPVTLTFAEGELDQIIMQQPTPQFGEIFQDHDAFAELLSIHTDDLSDTPIQAVSTGVPFTFVPLKSIDAVRRCELRLDIWKRLLQPHEANSVFVFTTETEDPAAAAHSRMFAPSMNITEDPATGAACGPLGAYLVQYELAAAGTWLTNEQGYEMGRPSQISIRVDREAGTFTRILIGGRCVMMGSGYLLLPD